MESPDEYRIKQGVAYRDDPPDDYARERCLLDVYGPADAHDRPVVVWFYGGGLRDGARHIPEPLKKQGLVIVAPDYRLFPRAKSPDYIEDAAAATAWTFRNIARFGGSPDRVFIAGASAGAYLAAMVCLDRRWLAGCGESADRLKGLISLTGQMVTHFTVREERGLPGHRVVVDDLAPFYHIRADAPPVLLVTGDRNLELLGRYEENAYFLRMLEVAGHRDHALHELPGLDHGGVEIPGHAFLLSFVNRLAERQP